MKPILLLICKTKNIPADEITLAKVAEQILQSTPEQGYLTISNACNGDYNINELLPW